MPRRTVLKFIVFAACLFCLLACSQHTAKIVRVSVQPYFLQVADNDCVPRLSVFLHYDDEDGQNDIDSLKLVHLESGATWIINASDLNFFKTKNLSENEFIVGTNKLTFPADKILSGAYKLSLVQSDYSPVFIDCNVSIDNTPAAGFPIQVQVNHYDAQFETDMRFNSMTVILLGADMQPLFSTGVSVTDRTYNFESLVTEYSDARYIRFLFDTSNGMFLSTAEKIE